MMKENRANHLPHDLPSYLGRCAAMTLWTDSPFVLSRVECEGEGGREGASNDHRRPCGHSRQSCPLPMDVDLTRLNLTLRVVTEKNLIETIPVVIEGVHT